jgi:hypothetical protein
VDKDEKMVAEPDCGKEVEPEGPSTPPDRGEQAVSSNLTSLSNLKSLAGSRTG